MNPLVGFLLGLGKDLVDTWRKKKERQDRIEEAVTESKIRLAQSEQTHNQTWELAQINGQDKNLRRISFAVWSTPAVWAMFDPVGIQESFSAALAALPEWYVYGYLAMTGAIWGIAEMRSLGFFRGVQK